MEKNIKFYPINDLFFNLGLDNAFKRVKSLSQDRNDNLNYIIELYNVTKYIESNIKLNHWNAEDEKSFINSKSILLKRINLFFKTILSQNFSKKTNDLNKIYYDDFVTLFELHKLGNRISENQFQRFVAKKHINIRLLLESEYISNTYPKFIKKSFLHNSLNAEILLDKYITISDSTKSLFIPRNISSEECSQLIERYIDNPDANYNYIQLIKNIQNEINGLIITDEIRLKAKRKEESETESIISTGKNMHFRYEVKISPDQKKEVVAVNNSSIMSKSYSSRWLKDHLDYNTVLNNFIYLFQYIDSNMRINLLSLESELAVFERFMGVDSKKDYKKGVAFDSKEIISSMEMAIYSEFLKKQNKSIEEAIEWYFTKYLEEELNIKGFQITMPSMQTTYEEKCHKVVAEMEKVVKEFSFYVEKGEIDFDLLRISTGQVNYSQIPSLLKDKYVYPVKDNSDLQFMLNALFSDQTGLGYIDDERNEPTFIELIVAHREIKYKDFPKFHKHNIDRLIKMKILKKMRHKVMLDNITCVLVLKNIFNSGFILYDRVNSALQKEIDRMKKKKLLRTGNTFFAEPEAEYMDYYLNNKRFTNSRNLRNSYSHGTQPNSEDEQAHRNNYIILLKLLILIVIKTNDEFCISSYKNSL